MPGVPPKVPSFAGAYSAGVAHIAACIDPGIAECERSKQSQLNFVELSERQARAGLRSCLGMS